MTPSGFVSIGAGNVATHLVKGLCGKGFKLIQVYSRTEDSAVLLSSRYNAGYTNSINNISKDADFYLVALPDNVLPEFLNRFSPTGKLIFHTSGSLGTDVFNGKYSRCGVLYPLQTFTKNVELNLHKIPILIESPDKTALIEIQRIAESLSPVIYETSAESRRWIHLAAVFACNFTNHMYAVSTGILHEKNLDPAILKPLMEETFRKSLLMEPAEAQTGPAVRNDSSILDAHIKMLDNRPLLQKIYTFTSESIQYLRDHKHNKSGK